MSSPVELSLVASHCCSNRNLTGCCLHFPLCLTPLLTSSTYYCHAGLLPGPSTGKALSCLQKQPLRLMFSPPGLLRTSSSQGWLVPIFRSQLTFCVPREVFLDRSFKTGVCNGNHDRQIIIMMLLSADIINVPS